MEKLFSKGWIPVRRSDDDSGSQDGLLPGNGSDTGSDGEAHFHRRPSRRGCILTLINVVVCLITVGAALMMVSSREDPPRYREDKLVFGNIDFKSYHSSTNLSRFWTDEANSIYIKPPSPEVDAAWDNLSLEGLEMATVTADQARALGHDLNMIAKVPESWGLGPDRYFAQIQVFHLIHCLDEMRKQMHYDYYHKAMFGDNPPQDVHNHKAHCIHVLLENLVCQASSSIIVHNWRKTFHVPYADFHPQRQCRNFDALWEAGRDAAIPDYRPKWRKLQIPSGATVLPAPTPRLYP